jgi:hypothetical protein
VRWGGRWDGQAITHDVANFVRSWTFAARCRARSARRGTCRTELGAPLAPLAPPAPVRTPTHLFAPGPPTPPELIRDLYDRLSGSRSRRRPAHSEAVRAGRRGDLQRCGCGSCCSWRRSAVGPTTVFARPKTRQRPASVEVAPKERAAADGAAAGARGRDRSHRASAARGDRSRRARIRSQPSRPTRQSHAGWRRTISCGTSPASSRRLRKTAASRGIWKCCGHRKPFAVQQSGGRTTIDPRSYRRYDAMATAIGSLDPGASAKLYSIFRPRLREAYGELGFPNTPFDTTLEDALVTLVSTPVPDGPIDVVSQGRDLRVCRSAARGARAGTEAAAADGTRECAGGQGQASRDRHRAGHRRRSTEGLTQSGVTIPASASTADRAIGRVAWRCQRDRPHQTSKPGFEAMRQHFVAHPHEREVTLAATQEVHPLSRFAHPPRDEWAQRRRPSRALR